MFGRHSFPYPFSRFPLLSLSTPLLVPLSPPSHHPLTPLHPTITPLSPLYHPPLSTWGRVAFLINGGKPVCRRPCLFALPTWLKECGSKQAE